MDYVVGQLMATLRETGMDKNTMVIFTSDNGPEVGTVIEMRGRHQHDGAYPWRGMKRDNWEGGHRVPTIVWWPSVIESGSEVDQTICLTDLFATIADIIGTSYPMTRLSASVSSVTANQNTMRSGLTHFTRRSVWPLPYAEGSEISEPPRLG